MIFVDVLRAQGIALEPAPLTDGSPRPRDGYDAHGALNAPARMATQAQQTQA